MSFPALKDAQGKLDAARKSLKSIFDEAGPDYDMSKVKSISGDTAEKLGWIRTKNEEIDGLKSKVEDCKALERAAAEARRTGEGFEGGESEERRPSAKGGIGELFTKSRAFAEKGRAAHLDVELKDLFERTDGWPPESVRSGRVELTPQRPSSVILPYIPQGSISQPLYKYMEETTFATDSADSDNLAGVTAEGGTFTEGELNLTERSQAVEKITVWLPMTDEQLEDEPAARSYVQQRLTYMVQAKLDKEIALGSGSSNHLLGTENVVGIQSQAKGGDTTLDATYKLFTLIRTDGWAEPNVVFINPSKWQEVALLKTADGQYIWGHPSASGPASVWGVPVRLSTVHTSTKAIAGDFSAYSQLFVRRGLDVQVTNAHSDYFVKGKQAIRMDMRAVMVHFRPKAFGVVTGL
ncbi:phage major capsid protein [Streptomyces sp. NPDC001774]